MDQAGNGWARLAAIPITQRHRRVIAILILLPLFLIAIPASFARDDESACRVLFIGNSYTAMTRRSLIRIVNEGDAGVLQAGFVVPGGMTLARHFANPDVTTLIREGAWDFVVLQDQSQTPALPGRHGDSFQVSVDRFAELIRDSGAEPILFETWGRRDGDLQNPDLFPDYATMQASLSEAYRSAADRNGLAMAPVGEVWAAVRRVNPRLGKQLYAADGSHPSAAGAQLAAEVLLGVIFNENGGTAGCPEVMKPRDCETIRREVRRGLERAPNGRVFRP